MARRKRPSQRRADQREERERRKRLRWVAEREQAEKNGILFSEETTFETNPGANVRVVLPAVRTPEEAEDLRRAFEAVQAGAVKPAVIKQGIGPADAQFTDVLDANFKQLETFCAATIERMDVQQNVIEAQTKVLDELAERIQDLEVAALGKPLEEVT